MRKGLYLRLAFQNLSKNAILYLPFLVASSLMVFVYYTVSFFATAETFGHNIPYGNYLQGLMGVGMYVMPVICAPFLWYINSFLMKRRKRELGLYGFLGMERRHVARIMLWEALLCLGASLAAGLLAGAALGRLLYLLLLNLLGAPVDMSYRLSWTPVAHTVRLFAVIFAACLLFNLFRVSVVTPASLLQEPQKGEKDSPLVPLVAVLGVFCLGGGYYLSLTARLDGMLLMVFLLAVILVIAGTYGVFTAGSSFLLKALRRRKSFYYRPCNFVTLSGMIHRMRKNAAGLVNICIFGTMVLVAMSCVAAVWAGYGQVMALLRDPPKLEGVGLDLTSLPPEVIITEFGTLIFLGLFFSIVFFGCTVLVMYYKQVTEGYEDRARFLVMRQVGMDEALSRSTVRRQILLVFFLPLAGALVHMAFAVPILIKLLGILRIDDLGLILTAFGLTALAFGAVYVLAYLITARAYSKLIQ